MGQEDENGGDLEEWGKGTGKGKGEVVRRSWKGKREGEEGGWKGKSEGVRGTMDWSKGDGEEGRRRGKWDAKRKGGWCNISGRG